MYSVFESIPKKKRQQAFDHLRRLGYDSRVSRSVRNEQGHNMCPLGAVNLTYPELKPLVSRLMEHPVCLAMPQSGQEERAILAAIGIDVYQEDAERFMLHNDWGQFDTIEKLATAMGADYQPEDN